MSNIKHIVTIGAISLVLLACFSCTEAPFEPHDTSEGYNVYFYTEINPEKWYTYNPEKDKLDSVILPTPYSYSAAISPVGDRLYLARFYGSGLLVVDLETQELVTELPFDAHHLDLSPDGGLLALGYTDLSLVNTTDWSVSFRAEEAPLQWATFSRDSDYLLGGYEDSYGWTTAADPAIVVAVQVTVGLGIALGGRVLTSPTNDHWYLLSRPHLFIDWDREADSAVFVDTVTYLSPYYSHHITWNGKYVAYPSNRVSYTRYTELRIYDTELQQLVDEVETIIYHDSGDTTYFAIDEMVMTPDSKWLVGITHQPSDYILVYNLEELRIERFLEIAGNHTFVTPVCQTGE